MANARMAKPYLRLLMGVAMLPALLFAQPPSSPPAEDVARAVQHHYDQVKDFTADFAHTYTGGVLKKTVTEHGTVQIKKPGRMRWEYTAPERKTFVSDGHKIYSYVPADRQVIVATCPGKTRRPRRCCFSRARVT